jgi:flagellar protein FlbD
MIVLNAELIKMLEPTPDTIVTLIGGDKFVVKESIAEVIDRVIDYRQRTLKNLTYYRQEAEK